MEPVDGFPVWAEGGGGLESLEWREQELREGWGSEGDGLRKGCSGS